MEVAGRERGIAELVQSERAVEVLEAMVADPSEVGVGCQLADDRSDEDLPAVRRRHHPRGDVHVHPDVLGTVHLGGADVDPRPHRQAEVAPERHNARSGVHGIGSRRERVEQSVAGVVDLITSQAAERFAAARQEPV